MCVCVSWEDSDSRYCRWIGGDGDGLEGMVWEVPREGGNLSVIGFRRRSLQMLCYRADHGSRGFAVEDSGE